MANFFSAEDFGYIEDTGYDGLRKRSEIVADLANAKVAPLLSALAQAEPLLANAEKELLNSNVLLKKAENENKALIAELEVLRLGVRNMADDPQWGNEYSAVVHFKSENEKLIAENERLKKENKTLMAALIKARDELTGCAEDWAQNAEEMLRQAMVKVGW